MMIVIDGVRYRPEDALRRKKSARGHKALAPVVGPESAYEEHQTGHGDETQVVHIDGGEGGEGGEGRAEQLPPPVAPEPPSDDGQKLPLPPHRWSGSKAAWLAYAQTVDPTAQGLDELSRDDLAIKYGPKDD